MRLVDCVGCPKLDNSEEKCNHYNKSISSVEQCNWIGQSWREGVLHSEMRSRQLNDNN